MMLRSGASHITKKPVGVKHIFRLSHIFEILKTVVGFSAVLVIHLLPSGKRSDESSHDEAMGGEFKPNPLAAKPYPSIAGFFDRTSDQSRLCFSSIAPRSNASEISVIANLIQTFKSDNCFPVFHSLSIGRITVGCK